MVDGTAEGIFKLFISRSKDGGPRKASDCEIDTGVLLWRKKGQLAAKGKGKGRLGVYPAFQAEWLLIVYCVLLCG